MSESNKKFIISVVPLARISLNHDQFFYYLYPKKISKGSLVSISLGKRKMKGIVIDSKTDFKRLGNIRLKKIEGLIAEKFLNPKQLKLAEFISDHYLVSLGIVLKSFVPKKVKARHTPYAIRHTQHKKINLTNEQKNVIKQITKSNGSKFKIQDSKFYLYGPASSGKTEIYTDAMQEILKRDPMSQFLILLPELTLVPQAVEKYGDYFKKSKIAILTGKISKGQFYQNWQRIKSGQAKIIIGTRQAIFAPFKKLKLIIVDEEQDISFKQWDMNPRYDARKSAEELAKIHKAKILFGSATPSVESYHKALNKKYKLLKLPALKKLTAHRSPLTACIVDMRREKWEKNHSPISKKLEAEIEYALKYKLQIILFINRQGMSAFSICKNCKKVLKCPQCGWALVYQNGGIYRCLHCGYKSSLFMKCPYCQGMDFKNIGLGTQKIEMEIRQKFPAAKIARADFETMKKAKAQENLYRKFSKNKIDILIGTQMIAKNWDLQNVGLVAIIDADNLLNMPDFRTNEKAFQNLVQVSGRTGRWGSKIRGKIIIQTYAPENFIVKTAAEMNFEKFYQKEIEERKTLGYPPFSRLIKIIFQDKNEKKVEKEIQETYREISRKLKNKKNIRIIAPHSPLVPKVRGKFKRQIIIKIKAKKAPAELKNVLKKLSAGWIIDVDPASVI